MQVSLHPDPHACAMTAQRTIAAKSHTRLIEAHPPRMPCAAGCDFREATSVATAGDSHHIFETAATMPAAVVTVAAATIEAIADVTTATKAPRPL